MYWVTSLVLVCLIVTQARCANVDDGKYVYVITKLKDVLSCIPNPIDDVCPVAKEVLKINGTVYSQLSQSINSTSASLRSLGQNDTCIEAAKMYRCSLAIFVCDTNYVYLDSAKAYKLCMTARQNCSGLNEVVKDNLFTCTNKMSPKRMRNVMCQPYPSVESGACPKQDYKVPSFVNTTSGSLHYNEVKDLLKKSKEEKTCTNSVLGAVCDIVYSACTKNGEYAVAVLGKEKCKKTMGCLKNGTLAAMGMLVCNGLPDESTAKKLPICDIDIPTCGGLRLYAMNHILVVFIVWLFVGSFVKF